MNQQHVLPYLAIVEAAMAENLQPYRSNELRMSSTRYSHRILAWLTAEQRVASASRESTRAAYHNLLPQMWELLNDEAGVSLISALQRATDDGIDHEALRRTSQNIAIRLCAWPPADDRCALAKRLLGEMLSIEQRVQSAGLEIHDRELQAQGDGTSKGSSLDAAQIARLTSWLRHTFPGNEVLQVTDSKALPGGFAKQTVLISLHGSRTLPESLIVRLDWSKAPGGNTVVDEFGIIQALFDAGVAVPRPYALEASGAVLGGAFLLLSKVEGRVTGDVLGIDAGSEVFAESLAITLAKMHRVRTCAFGPRIAGATESTRERMLREIAAFENNWRSLQVASVPLQIAFAWLEDNISLADGARSLVHKDVGCHNILVQGNSVAALLDWETAAIGNPAQDLGYVYPLVVQMTDWEAFMQVYVANGGMAPSRAQIEYYTLWGFVWLTVLAMQARGLFNSGSAHDIGLAYAATYLLTRFETRLTNLLAALVT